MQISDYDYDMSSTEEHPTSCSAYSKCAAAGLSEGACCPSNDGMFPITKTIYFDKSGGYPFSELEIRKSRFFMTWMIWGTPMAMETDDFKTKNPKSPSPDCR